MFLSPCLVRGAREAFPARLQSPFSKSFQCFGVLRGVPRPRRKHERAGLLQLPAQGRFMKPDRKFRMEPLCQVDRAPAHTPMERRDRTALDKRRKRRASGITEPGVLARRLPCHQSARPARER